MSIMESDNIKFIKDALDNAVIKKTIKIYRLVCFDDHLCKNGSFIDGSTYFTKEEALEAQKENIDNWEQYCNLDEENKNRAKKYGTRIVKVVSFEMTEEG